MGLLKLPPSATAGPGAMRGLRSPFWAKARRFGCLGVRRCPCRVRDGRDGDDRAAPGARNTHRPQPSLCEGRRGRAGRRSLRSVERQVESQAVDRSAGMVRRAFDLRRGPMAAEAMSTLKRC